MTSAIIYTPRELFPGNLEFTTGTVNLDLTTSATGAKTSTDDSSELTTKEIGSTGDGPVMVSGSERNELNLYNLLKYVAYENNMKLDDPSEVFNIVLQIDSKPCSIDNK